MPSEKQRQADASKVCELPPWKRWLFLLAGAMFFGLAVLGVILPVLPTTPFLLLASYFFVRSSPKLNEAMLRSKWFGPLLYDWQIRGGVKQSVKVKAIVVIVVAVALTIYFSNYNYVLTYVVIFLVIIGLYVIYKVPTVEDRQKP